MAIIRLALAGTALAGGQAIAQTIPKTTPENLAPDPIKVPLPTPSATPVGEAPLIVVPVEPSSAPQAPPRARPTRRAPVPRPTVQAAPEPREMAPSATATPVVAPGLPEPSPVTPPPVIVPTAPPETGEAWRGWLLPAGLGGVIALFAGWMLRRRRGGGDRVEGEAEIASIEVEAPEGVTPPIVPVPAPAAPQFLERPAPSARAWLDLAGPAVHRAGINLITATADVALVVRNEGVAPARGIRLALRLTSAQPGQDAVLDALYAEPVERPIVPPFDLAPGEERMVRGIATLPREAIVALTAAGRPMFVPVIALNLLYDAGGGMPGQTTAAFAVGVERPDGGKLGPLWLDEPARMYDAIGIRAHGTTVKR